MKKTILRSILAALCLFSTAYAQPAQATGPVGIGEKIPDIQVTYYTGSKPFTAKLSSFRGKALILDFWATWCSPCVMMLQRMDYLQKQYAGRVQFLSVAYQPRATVQAFLANFERQRNIHLGLAEIYGDTALARLFPHRTLPHYVWIDAWGTVRTFTEFTKVNSASIDRFLANDVPEGRPKIDVIRNYDVRKPLFNYADADSILKSRSILTGYIAGIGGGSYHNFRNTDTTVRKRITARNLGIAQLYQLAYGGGTAKINWNRTLLRTKDTTALNSDAIGERYTDWQRTHGFCYELIVSGTVNPFPIMLQDLARNFPQYTAGMESMRVRCLVLRNTGKGSPPLSSGNPAAMQPGQAGFAIHDRPISFLTNYMDYYVMQGMNTPVLDETGLPDKIDLIVNSSLSDIGRLNAELRPYGLEFSYQNRNVSFLVIRDHVPGQANHPSNSPSSK